MVSLFPAGAVPVPRSVQPRRPDRLFPVGRLAFQASAFQRERGPGARRHRCRHLATCTGEPRRLLAGCLVTDFARPEQTLRDTTGYGRRINVKALLTVDEYAGLPYLAHSAPLMQADDPVGRVRLGNRILR